MVENGQLTHRYQAKVDEEMAKIVVDVGVYLSSDPDGKVIDIDRESGCRLQSHAKMIHPPNFMSGFRTNDLSHRHRSWSHSKSARPGPSSMSIRT